VVTDTRGFTTTTVYDTQYRLYPLQVRNAKGQTTQYQYYGINGVAADGQPIGLLKSTIDPNSSTTTYKYDGFGRLKRIFYPGDDANNPTEEYYYYDGGDGEKPLTAWPLQIVHARRKVAGPSGCAGGWGGLERLYYDGLGRVIQQHSPMQDWTCTSGQIAVVNTFYDARGQVVEQSAPYAVVDTATNGLSYYQAPDRNKPSTKTTYDALGRVVRTTNPDGTYTTQSYYVARNANDGDFRAGRVSSNITDANNHVKRYSYDGRGQLRIVTEFVPGSEYRTRYTYDTLGNLTQVRDALGNTTVITYNTLSQKTAMIDPDMGAWKYEYDAAGNLITQTDALNNALWFKYDPLNRLIEKRQSNSSGALLARYTYGSTAPNIGYRLRMDDPSGYTTWAYDNRGRVTQETKVISNTGGGTFVTQYGYDAMDRPVWMKYPGGNAGQIGEQVNFTYNAAGLLNSVIGASTYAQSTTYDAVGRVTQRVLGDNVLQQNYVYYPWTTFKGQGRLQQIKAGVPGNLTSLQDLNYTYDAVGNVLTILDNKAGGAQTQTFTYDALDRLQTAQASGGTGGTYALETYTYDQIGNIKSKPGVGVYTYTASATGCVAGTPAIKPHAVRYAGSYSFTYDCNGNMISRADSIGTFTQQWDKENRLITVTGSATASFVYDGDGNRVKATLGPTTTVYIGNYYEQSGNITTTYYYAGGTRIAMRQGSTVNYLLGDHLGSTSITANSSGGLFAELRYKPWGEERYTNGVTTPTRRQYTGQIKDAEIGLYFYGARMYSSVLGRFISADTLVPDGKNPQAWNRYAYTLNSPLRYIDPSGHGQCDPANGKCEGGPNTSGSRDGVGGDGPKRPVESGKEVGEPNGPYQKVYTDSSGRLVQIDYNGKAHIDGKVEMPEVLPKRYTRVVPEDQVGTSQPFKTTKGEDGLSVFEGVSSEQVLKELPGKRVPNTTVEIPYTGLPEGTKIVPTEANGLSQLLSDAHRILVRPDGWSIDRFAKALKILVGWGD
jgi:RHS repeat-associated protein